jgi:hypothetical protein
MRNPDIGVFLLCLSLAACGGDRTITWGADGEREWDRKLRAAVSVGTPVQDVVLVMERNGFRCEAPDGQGTSLRCDKTSSGFLKPVKRRWQATFETRDGHVEAVHASTGLVGP